jgi:hypothetical protein
MELVVAALVVDARGLSGAELERGPAVFRVRTIGNLHTLLQLNG